MTIRTLVTSLTLCFSFAASAQINTMPTRWSGGVISLTQASPYIGGDTSPAIFPFVAYRGEKLIWQGPNLEYFVKGRPNDNALAVSVNLSLAPNELEVDGDPRLAGIVDRNNSMMAGVTLRYPMGGGLIGVTVQTMAIGQHDGQRATLEWQRPLFSGPQGKWQVLGGVQLEYLSANYANYYFGVSQQEANASVFDAYSLGAQSQLGLSVGGFYRFAERWMVLSNLSATALADDIEDSPIVADSNVFNGFVGVSYQF